MSYSEGWITGFIPSYLYWFKSFKNVALYNTLYAILLNITLKVAYLTDFVQI